MAGGVSIKIEGVKQLEATFEKLGSLSNLKTAMNKATAMVLGQAKMIVPVDTSALRNSLHSSREDKPNEMIGKVATSLEHGMYVEFGTGVRGSETGRPPANGQQLAYGSQPGQVAQPYMYPALKMNEGKIQKLFAEAVIKTAMKG